MAFRCALCALRGPVASSSRLMPTRPALGLARAGIGESHVFAMPAQRRSITFVPRKQRRRVSYKIRQIKWSGTSKGTTLQQGEIGLRTLWPARIKQATFATMHQHLQRYTKAFKDVRIYWKRFPYRGQSEKGSEVKMGKGRGTFSYLADAVPGGRVLVELTVPGMTRPELVRALRATASRCPVKCEVIDRYNLPKVGLEEVPRGWKHPHSMFREAHPPFGIVKQGVEPTDTILTDIKEKGASAASRLPIEQVMITQGRKAGQVMHRMQRTAAPADWRRTMLQIFGKGKAARQVSPAS